MPQNVPSPDDRRVLDELERLRDAIRATRGGSGAPLGAEPGQVAGAVREGAGRPPTRTLTWPDPEPGPRAVPLPVSDLAAEPATPSVAPPLSTAAPPTEVAARTVRAPGRARSVVIALAAATAVLLGWFLLRDPAPAPPIETAAVAREAIAPPAAAEPPAAPVDPHPLRIDIVTSRPVWMRVTVDGRIAIERMLPQGERLPFGADKSIVVRAGDAGAVSVWIGAVDKGPLGRDGQVVTRLFEAPLR